MSAAPYSAVFFEDRFVPSTELATACVPITDPGYLLGEGVFETLRGYDGRCFRVQRHLDRILRGAALFGLTLPLSRERIGSIVDDAARRSGEHTAYVRITLTRGSDGDRGVLSVLARAFDVPSESDYEHGIAVSMVTARRVPPSCIDSTIKTTSYAPTVLARREAARLGTPEGIQLTVDGALACGTMANLFLVTGNVLRTPSLTSGCRAGVTREALLELARRAQLDVREERIEPGALVDADEVFFTSSRVEILPIASVDGRALRASRFPCAHALRTQLREVIEAETAS